MRAVRLRSCMMSKKLCIENLSFRFTGRKLLLEDVDRETERFVCNILDTLRNLFITVFVTHRLETAKKLADRIYVIDHGRKIAEGYPKDIATNERVITAYLGSGGVKKDED